MLAFNGLFVHQKNLCNPVIDSWYIFALQPSTSLQLRARQDEIFGHFRLVLAWDFRAWDELLSFLLPLSSLLKVAQHREQQLFVSHVSMDTIIDSSSEFDTCVVCMCIFAHFLHLSHTLNPFPTRSLCAATSSTRLEDLSYLDNQRAAGHRSSVRKHNTAGRTNDDSKGILWLTFGANSVCKYNLVQTHLQTCVEHVRTSPMSLLKLHVHICTWADCEKMGPRAQTCKRAQKEQNTDFVVVCLFFIDISCNCYASLCGFVSL